MYSRILSNAQALMPFNTNHQTKPTIRLSHTCSLLFSCAIHLAEVRPLEAKHHDALPLSHLLVALAKQTPSPRKRTKREPGSFSFEPKGKHGTKDNEPSSRQTQHVGKTQICTTSFASMVAHVGRTYTKLQILPLLSQVIAEILIFRAPPPPPPHRPLLDSKPPRRGSKLKHAADLDHTSAWKTTSNACWQVPRLHYHMSRRLQSP